MSGVYRTKASVPPEPLYASLLSPFRRAHRGAPPPLAHGPTWHVPLWNDVQPSSGLPAPPRPVKRPHVLSPVATYLVVSALTVGSLCTLALVRSEEHTSELQSLRHLV